MCSARFGALGRLNYAAGEYIAVANGGGIRAGLDAGPVYKEDLVAVLPFSNEVRFAVANGTVVKQMLEHSVRNDGPSGGFLSVHGLQFWWDPKGKPGERVQRVMVRSNRKHGARPRMGPHCGAPTLRFRYSSTPLPQKLSPWKPRKSIDSP